MTKKILIDEVVVKQALEWIEDAAVVLSHTSTAIQGGLGAEAEGVGGCSVKVLKDLREALAQQQQAAEPVDSERIAALRTLSYCDGIQAGWNFCADGDEAAMARALSATSEAMRLLKTHPAPTHQPLTDERLSEIESRILQEGGSYAEVLRAVADEAVHTGSKT